MRNVSTIGLVTAVPFEAEFLIAKLKGKRKSGPFTTGALGELRIAHISAGLGAANAAHGATLLIERHRPGAVFLAGIGGAYPGAGITVGGIAAAEKEIYADLGVIAKDGFLPIDVTGIPLLEKGGVQYYNEYPLDGNILGRLRRRMPEIKTGVFLTVSQVTGTAERARHLRERYGAVCENMEGAAVAQICTAYGMPLLEIRGISNMVEDRDPGKWEKSLAAENCQKAVMEFLTDEKEWLNQCSSRR